MVFSKLFKERASWHQFYDHIPYEPNYKFGLDILKELEAQDLSVRFMRGNMYVHLSRWEQQGLVTSRADPVPAGFEGLARREYARTSNRKPKEFEEKKVGLTLIVNPV